VRADLLAVAAADVEDRLQAVPSFPGAHRPNRRASDEIASVRLLGAFGASPGHR
jgi:hypothetical protein